MAVQQSSENIWGSRQAGSMMGEPSTTVALEKQCRHYLHCMHSDLMIGKYITVMHTKLGPCSRRNIKFTTFCLLTLHVQNNNHKPFC